MVEHPTCKPVVVGSKLATTDIEKENNNKYLSTYQDFSGLYYKHVTIINDDSSISKLSFKLIDDARVVIYDCNKFILQATDV